MDEISGKELRTFPPAPISTIEDLDDTDPDQMDARLPAESTMDESVQLIGTV